MTCFQSPVKSGAAGADDDAAAALPPEAGAACDGAPPQAERERQSAAQSIREKILSFIGFSSNFRYSTGIQKIPVRHFHVTTGVY